MATHALITNAVGRRRLAGITPPARVLTSSTPGEILLGCEVDGGPIVRIPAAVGRDTIEAAAAALIDLLDRLDAPSADLEPDFENEPEADEYSAQSAAGAAQWSAEFQDVFPPAKQPRANRRRKGAVAQAVSS